MKRRILRRAPSLLGPLEVLEHAGELERAEREALAQAPHELAIAWLEPSGRVLTLDAFLARAEVAYVRHLLAVSGGRVSQAAQSSGRCRAHFYRVMERAGAQRRPYNRGSWDRALPEG